MKMSKVPNVVPNVASGSVPWVTVMLNNQAPIVITPGTCVSWPIQNIQHYTFRFDPEEKLDADALSSTLQLGDLTDRGSLVVKRTVTVEIKALRSDGQSFVEKSFVVIDEEDEETAERMREEEEDNEEETEV